MSSGRLPGNLEPDGLIGDKETKNTTESSKTAESVMDKSLYCGFCGDAAAHGPCEGLTAAHTHGPCEGLSIRIG
jgi:hypothetical protein